MYWFIIKDIIKDMNEQPDEEIYKVRSGRVLSTGASAPWSWAASSPDM